MDNLDDIENFFEEAADPGKSEAFSRRIQSDPAFAEAVAFYLSAKEAAGQTYRQEQEDRFRKLYQQEKTAARPAPVRKLIAYLSAAAALAAVVFGLYHYAKPESPSTLADKYIKDEFFTLGVTMGAKTDTLQNGLILFNDGKLAEALTLFERLSHQDSLNAKALEYAGITALRLKQYDKSIGYFQSLARDTALYANPGLFYEAVARIERNQPGDRDQAMNLLTLVAGKKGEGENFAREWLKHW